MTPNKIMIVEDERIVALDLSKQLSNLGYNVVAVAANGQSAIEKAKLTLPDLTLMDIHLEGNIDGIDTAKTLWEQLRIPIVFVTALAEDATVARASGAQPFGYLVKPTDPRELNATIQSALSRRHTEQQLELNEERLRFAINSSDLGVWEWEMTTNRLITHGNFDLLLGMPIAAPPTTLNEFLATAHASDRSRLNAVLHAIGGHGGYIRETFRSAKEGYPPRYLTLEAQSYDSSRVIGTLHRAIAHRNIENRLSKTTTIYDAIAESVAILKLDGSILSVNPAFRNATGYADHEVINRPLAETLKIRYHAQPFDSEQCGNANFSWSGEVSGQYRNEETFMARMNIAIARNEAGKPSYLIASITNIDADQHAREQWRELAHHDALTGMANRLLLQDRLTQAITSAKRNNQHCAVLFIDLDEFKGINDTFGHAVGDQILQLTAKRINKALRSCDTLARLGGDEFVVVTNDVDPSDGMIPIAEKILQAIAQPLALDSQQRIISASIGIAIYPNDGADALALLKNADTAMYEAKHSGRNGYCFYNKPIICHEDGYISTEKALRTAVERGELRLTFQPIYNLADNSLSGIEALVRWQHPTHGLLQPKDFMAVAEECGFLSEIETWVLRAACLGASVLRTNGATCRLCVNVSFQQLVHSPVYDTVKKILWETGFPGSLLELEIAESCLHHIDKIRPVLDQLHKLGVTIAIDNYGNGYAPLGTLKNVPIHRIKLNRSLVHALRAPSRDSSIATAIGQFGLAYGIQTTAPGIEQEVELNVLKQFGFTEGQGHYFSPPVDLQSLLVKISNQTAIRPRPMS